MTGRISCDITSFGLWEEDRKLVINVKEQITRSLEGTRCLWLSFAYVIIWMSPTDTYRDSTTCFHLNTIQKGNFSNFLTENVYATKRWWHYPVIFRIEWWTSESPRAHVAKFYGLLRLTRNVLRASKFSVLKLTEIVMLWVYNTIPFGFSSFWHFLGHQLLTFETTLFG